MLLECYFKDYVTWKITSILGTKPETEDHSQSVGSKTLFYPISIMPKICIEDSGNLKTPLKCGKYQ